jgi:DNA-binding Lrp family transcriptional regulator
MPEAARQLTLYVQSKKTVTTFYRPSANPTGFGPTTATQVSGGPTNLSEADAATDEGPVFFLSDDQSRALALTEEMALRRGYRVQVHDVEKQGRIERLVTEHLRGVQTFPVLVSPSGFRLVGCEQFTEENLAALMPTELKSVRALTYIKVKGGDLDRIRRMLEDLAEVKELHFLTGDWDILVVLQFPPTTTNKRQVLDFVTARIRGIPEVVDTSTLVPEYSVTKFP